MWQVWRISIQGDNMNEIIFPPSNPCNWFVNGSKEEQFTHPHLMGAKPFYVNVYGKGKSGGGWIPISILVFADCEDNVKMLLRNAIDSRIECLKKYKAHYGNKEYKTMTDDELLDADESRVAFAVKVKKLLDGEEIIEKTKNGNEYRYYLTIVKAPTNQFYKVGWASNDIIF